MYFLQLKRNYVPKFYNLLNNVKGLYVYIINLIQSYLAQEVISLTGGP